MTHIYWVELLDSSSDSINQQIRPLISQIIIYQVGEKKKKLFTKFIRVVNTKNFNKVRIFVHFM